MECHGLFCYVLRPTIFYAPNPGYDAYWVNGQWVFGTASTTSRRLGHRSDITVPSVRFAMACGTPCPKVYRKLKEQVCVQQVDNVYAPPYDGWWRGSAHHGLVDWRLGGVMDRNYDYLRNFDSYCQFLDMQCRVKVFHDMGMIFIHMGPCLLDKDTFHPLYYGQDVKNNKLQAVARYRNQIDRKHADLYNEAVCDAQNTSPYPPVPGQLDPVDYMRGKIENRIEETGSCYLLSNRKAWFSTGDGYCKWRGGHLVVIDDENERRVLNDLMQKAFQWNTDSFFYIGLVADYRTRIWYTCDGNLLSDLNFAPWAPGENNNEGGRENCGVIDRSIRLYDVPCDLYNHFVCEFEVQSDIKKYA